MDNWQLIETAPKDNIRIIVHNPDWWQAGIGRWHIDLSNGGEKAWLDDNVPPRRLDPPPTHWMPLPSKPQH